MSGSPVASIVIPSYQSSRTILRCLAGIFAQADVGPFEVIVVDSSTDDTAELIARHYPQVTVIKSTVRVSAEGARNRGAAAARAPILAFIDSDCVPPQDWLKRLCAVLQSGRYEGVGGAIANVEDANSTAWAGYFCEFREFLPGGAPCDATYLTPGNAAYLRDTFTRAGGFADGYFPLEDQVFYERLRGVGARIRFDPTIVVAHAHRTTVSAFLAHQRRIGSANARVATVLRIRGAAIASRRWLAAALLPALTTYRFVRTVHACRNVERCLILRRPAVAALCWLGMIAWGVGFVNPVGAAPGRSS